MSPRGLRPGQVNFRSHNSCFALGASSPGRGRACVLFGVSFRGGCSPTGLPGDTVWPASPPSWVGFAGRVVTFGGAAGDEDDSTFLGVTTVRHLAPGVTE